MGGDYFGQKMYVDPPAPDDAYRFKDTEDLQSFADDLGKLPQYHQISVTSWDGNLCMCIESGLIGGDKIKNWVKADHWILRARELRATTGDW